MIGTMIRRDVVVVDEMGIRVAEVEVDLIVGTAVVAEAISIRIDRGVRRRLAPCL